MPNYQVKVLGGDFKAGYVIIKTGGIRAERFKSIKSLKAIGSPLFKKEKFFPKDIADAQVVTSENSTSVVGKAAWAATGTVLLGPIGLLAGALGGGNKSITQVLVTLTDDRSFLIEGKPKHVNYLIQAPHLK